MNLNILIASLELVIAIVDIAILILLKKRGEKK